MSHRGTAMWMRASGRRGFTLVELILSVTVMAILAAAMVSVITISLRALDNGKGTSARAIATSDVLQDIAQDVNLAKAFIQRTAPGVKPVVLEFSVPDRNGDLLAETIKYEWSGASGAPLTRSYNGGTPVSVADDVRDFSLSYLTRFRKGAVPPAPPPPVESSEIVHSSFAPGGTSSNVFSSSVYLAEYFKPTLPTNTISWKVTRIEVVIARRTASSSGNAVVAIRNVDAAKKPTGTAIDSSSIAITTVPTSLTTVSFPFTGAGGIDPTAALAFTINGTTSTANGQAEFRGSVATGANIQYCESSTGGVSWSTPTSTKSLSFVVYGTYTTQGPPTW